MMYDPIEKLWSGILVALGVTVAVGLALALTDSVQEYRAFDSIVACQSQQQAFARRTLSSRAVCIPALSRRDTLSLQHTGVTP